MPNIRVDAAARIKAPSAAPSKLRNTLPPLASNDLFDGVGEVRHDMPATSPSPFLPSLETETYELRCLPVPEAIDQWKRSGHRIVKQCRPQPRRKLRHSASHRIKHLGPIQFEARLNSRDRPGGDPRV